MARASKLWPPICMRDENSPDENGKIQPERGTPEYKAKVEQVMSENKEKYEKAPHCRPGLTGNETTSTAGEIAGATMLARYIEKHGNKLGGSLQAQIAPFSAVLPMFCHSEPKRKQVAAAFFNNSGLRSQLGCEPVNKVECSLLDGVGEANVPGAGVTPPASEPNQ